VILTPPLIPATLLKRYKRFLADVRMSDGETITVHTPNTGSMLGLAEPGMRVWLRDTQSETRKYRYSWEMSEPQAGNFVGVHTGLVNKLVSEAIDNGTIEQLQGYERRQQEVRYGTEKSRIDLLLTATDHRQCYVEIKNVTAKDQDERAIFPDAVTTRGQKHLRELIHVTQAGHRAVLFFCVQRADAAAFRPANEIDPRYAEYLQMAAEVGVELYAYKAIVAPNQIKIHQSIPVQLI
jgi:sugar fermentation stimulation protein A